MNGLYLFTDGGGFPRKDKEGGFDGVSNFRFFDEEKNLIKSFSAVYEKKTNNFGEIHAMAVGLADAYNYLTAKEQKDFVINVITDSKISHTGLKEWIYNWIKNQRDGVFYNSKGEPVANQEEFKAAFAVMTKLKETGNVHLYHIKSHYPIKKIKDLKKYFETFNRLKLTDEEMLFVYEQNKACDESVETAYREFVKNKNIYNNLLCSNDN